MVVYNHYYFLKKVFTNIIFVKFDIYIQIILIPLLPTIFMHNKLHNLWYMA